MKFVRPIGLLLGFAALVLIWSNPLGSWTVIYCPVSERVEGWPFSQCRIVRGGVTDADGREFIVQQSELYLAVQATRPSLFLVTFVDMPRWDSLKIRRFRDRHPEVETLWPKPFQDNGGVQWAKSSEH